MANITVIDKKKKANGTIGSDNIDLREINKGAVIMAGAGDDKIFGTNLKDKIYTEHDTNEVHSGEGNDTIYSGDGNDTIYGDKGNDTINILGAGTKNIVINALDGNDTILNAKNADKINIIFKGYNSSDSIIWEKKGNNLVISATKKLEESKEVKETTTIKDYFKFESDITIVNDDEGSSVDLKKYIFNLGDISKSSNQTLKGTFADEKFIGGLGKDKISTGSGDDTVIAGKNNDTINITGSGIKDIIINNGDGNDTINGVSTKDATVNIVLNDITGKEFSINKNNLVITRTEANGTTATTTLTNYFKQPSVVTINNEDLASLLKNYFKNGDSNSESAQTLKGSWLDETFFGGEKNDKISTGAGHDVIHTGKSTINGSNSVNITGSGLKEIYVEGNTVITGANTKDSDAVLIIKDTQTYEVTKSDNNKDVVITLKTGETVDSTVTIKDYLKKEIFNDITIKNSNSEKLLIKNILQQDLKWDLEGYTPYDKHLETKKQTMVGTVLDEVFIGGSGADKISTGAGEDHIKTGFGNDTITLNGEGKKYITISSGEGSDTINMNYNGVKAYVE